MTDRPRQAEPAGHAADSWELLTHGELSREEQALLRTLAEDDEADALRLEAHAPLDESFRARMTDRLGTELERAARLRRRRAMRVIATTAVLAAAAALLVMLRPPSAQVPAYALAIEGQVATTRGPADPLAPLHLTPDSVLDIRLTPATRVGEALTLSAFLERDGQVVPWSVPVERASSGAFRIHGGARTLLPPTPGTWNAIFVIAPTAVRAPPVGDPEPGDLTVMRARLHYDEGAGGDPP